MYKAGYDPQAFIQFFEKIDALEKHKPGTLAKVFADHPQTPDRIAHSEEEIATIMPARPDYVVTTSEFDDIKASSRPHREQAQDQRQEQRQQAHAAPRRRHQQRSQQPQQHQLQRRPANPRPPRVDSSRTRPRMERISTDPSTLPVSFYPPYPCNPFNPWSAVSKLK